MPLTRVQRAYLAGIIDGEGSISLVRSNARSSSKYIYPTLRVASKDECLIKWLQDACVIGNIYTTKGVYHWCVASTEAIKIIAQIKKYLVIKKDQAELALTLWAENKAYRKKFGKDGKYFGNGWPIPFGLIEFRDMAFDYMQALNRREVSLCL